MGTLRFAVEQSEAYEIVSEWTQSHDGALLQQGGVLAPTVVDVVARLPTGAEFAVQRKDDGLSVLLVVQGSWLWWIKVPEEGTDVEHLPLVPLVARLALRQHYELRQRGPVQEQVRVTTYTLRISDLDGAVESLEIAGVEVLAGGFAGALRIDRNERFGRAVAAELGWSVA
jgi:hypothetical protein